MPSTRGDVEVVRISIDAFNRRDLPTLLTLVDPDVEWVPLRAVLDGAVYVGHAGIQRFLADMDEDIEGMTVHADEVFELGEHVVVYGSIRGRGRGSGMELELPIGWVIRVAGGRVIYLRAYPERDAALKAAEEPDEGVQQQLERRARTVDS